MALFGAAHNAWFFWDGRKDSLWSQALGPPESQAEHGISRTKTNRSKVILLAQLADGEVEERLESACEFFANTRHFV